MVCECEVVSRQVIAVEPAMDAIRVWVETISICQYPGGMSAMIVALATYLYVRHRLLPTWVGLVP